MNPRSVLVLRPQPAADETADRARALGLEPVVAPLFDVRPLDWKVPQPADHEVIMVTSANAARHGGKGLERLLACPCYAVGEGSEAAARRAGFQHIRVGPSDGVALVEMMAADGVKAAIHLCGREHVPLSHPRIQIREVPVYAAEARTALSGHAQEALAQGTLVLLHSPRAAALFARLVGERGRISLAVISQAAAQAAGPGWKQVDIAERPRDEALLELAAKLCQTAGEC